MQLTRRGFLKVIGASAAIAAAPSFASLGESPLAFEESAAQEGSFAGVFREVKAYDISRDSMMIRIDARVGNEQFGVNGYIGYGIDEEAVRSSLLKTLARYMDERGIKPRDLLPWDGKQVGDIKTRYFS